jgi:D-serine deaminase-like pyridoxal phosphate-dependent protein
MLSAILLAIRDAGKPMCLSDLATSLQIEEAALEGMLQTLVQRGRLRTIRFVDDGCGTCPVKGGCFIMNDGVAVTYALPPDATTAEHALPTFSQRSGRGAAARRARCA